MHKSEGVQCRPRVTSANCDSRSEEHTSELQSRLHLVCRLLLEKKKKQHLLRSPVTNVPDAPAYPKLLSVAPPCLHSLIAMLHIRGLSYTGLSTHAQARLRLRPF